MISPPGARRGLARRVAAFAALVVIGVAALVLASRHRVAPRVTLTRAEVTSAQRFPFDAHDRLLRRYVDAHGQGRVDYRRLRAERHELDRLLAFVAQVGPSSRPDLYPTESHRKAFFITAYNATVWRNVIDRPPLDRLGFVTLSFFYGVRFVIDGSETNLKDLEDVQIRRGFRDARVHFALNCASVGCP